MSNPDLTGVVTPQDEQDLEDMLNDFGSRTTSLPEIWDRPQFVSMVDLGPSDYDSFLHPSLVTSEDEQRAKGMCVRCTVNAIYVKGPDMCKECYDVKEKARMAKLVDSKRWPRRKSA